MFTKETLKNGLRIVTVPRKEDRTVTVLVVVETGSKYETKQTNGISHFLEHMFFKGTKKRPDTLSIATEIDNIGGEHNAFTSKEFTGYYAKAASKHKELLFDIISDMYLNSKFDPKEIAREKGVIGEEIKMYQDMPMRYVSDLFETVMFGDQPAGWHTIGTKENVMSWKREDFINYYKKSYVASNTIIFAAGNITSSKTKDFVRKYFSQLSNNAPPKKDKVLKKKDKSSLLLHTKDTDQTNFCLGVHAYPPGHPGRFPLEVLNNVLGGGMSSRLFIEVRERRGLAYYVKSEYAKYTDNGYMVIQVGTDNKKVYKSISVVLQELKKVKDKDVPPKELKKAKENLKGKLLLGLETSDEIAFWLAGQEVVKGKMTSPEEIFKKIDSVTKSDLKRVARDIFYEKGLYLAVIGPQKDKQKFLEKLTL